VAAVALLVALVSATEAAAAASTPTSEVAAAATPAVADAACVVEPSWESKVAMAAPKLPIRAAAKAARRQRGRRTLVTKQHPEAASIDAPPQTTLNPMLPPTNSSSARPLVPVDGGKGRGSGCIV